MGFKKLFLVRHAECDREGSDPHLTAEGKKQAFALAQQIKHLVKQGENVTIWNSLAMRAYETAQIIKEEMQLADVQVFPELWSDSDHEEDFVWLMSKINEFHGDVLIIVTHLEYVQACPLLPSRFRHANVGYADGFCIIPLRACLRIFKKSVITKNSSVYVQRSF